MDKFTDILLKHIAKRKEATKSVKGSVAYSRRSGLLEGLNEALGLYMTFIAEEGIGKPIKPVKHKEHSNDIIY